MRRWPLLLFWSAVADQARRRRTPRRPTARTLQPSLRAREACKDYEEGRDPDLAKLREAVRLENAPRGPADVHLEALEIVNGLSKLPKEADRGNRAALVRPIYGAVSEIAAVMSAG